MTDNVPIAPDRHTLQFDVESGRLGRLQDIPKLIVPLLRDYQRDAPAGLPLNLGINLLVQRIRAGMADDQEFQGWVTDCFIPTVSA